MNVIIPTPADHDICDEHGYVIKTLNNGHHWHILDQRDKACVAQYCPSSGKAMIGHGDSFRPPNFEQFVRLVHVRCKDREPRKPKPPQQERRLDYQHDRRVFETAIPVVHRQPFWTRAAFLWPFAIAVGVSVAVVSYFTIKMIYFSGYKSGFHDGERRAEEAMFDTLEQMGCIDPIKPRGGRGAE